MESWFPPILSAVIGGVAGGLFTYWTSREQLRIQAENGYDVSLRDLRLPHYQELYHLTGAIPREWWPASALSRREVVALRERFHAWNFGEGAGGMFLSQDARYLYNELQVELQEAARDLVHDEDAMDIDRIRKVQERAATLRHRLSSDLGTAEPPTRNWTLPSSPQYPKILERKLEAEQGRN